MSGPGEVLPTDANCANCEYAGQHKEGGSLYCFRYPPQSHFITQMKVNIQRGGVPEPSHVPVAMWPAVQPEQWCGEHERTRANPSLVIQ